MDTVVLDWTWADCAGSVAADERDDGPFCLRSAVANRCDKRILSDVLDHDPDHEDIRAFLGRLPTALTARDLTLVGITTAGSARSPEPRADLWRGVPPHRWALPGIAEVVKAGWGAVASARKRLAATHPTRSPGRPTTQAAHAAARTQKRLAPQRVALSTQRSLGVQHPLRSRDRTRLWRLTRGRPQWRTLRALMAQVSAGLDRRCRTQTALDKLANLRRRLLRCTPVGETLTQRVAPPLAQALPCLDAQLCPSTSHAVERGNRR